MTIDIILPIYNEEKILATNARRLLDYCLRHLEDDWGITLIINGSCDQSLAIAENLAKTSSKFKIIHLKNRGRGGALKIGFQETTADIAVYMDVDLAVSLEALPKLINLITKENFDLAVGSRLLADSQTTRSLMRESSSRLYSWLASRLLGCQISDWQCGFKAFNQKTLKTVVPLVEDVFWFFDTELLALANKANFKIAELPVCWLENRYIKRQSKVSLIRDSFIFVKKLFKLRSRLKKY